MSWKKSLQKTEVHSALCHLTWVYFTKKELSRSWEEILDPGLPCDIKGKFGQKILERQMVKGSNSFFVSHISAIFISFFVASCLFLIYVMERRTWESLVYKWSQNPQWLTTRIGHYLFGLSFNSSCWPTNSKTQFLLLSCITRGLDLIQNN